MAHVFRALKHRNYQLFFGGQTISLVGSWMQSLAMSWLVYAMTKSGALLGVVALSSQLPAFFVSPFAGVWIDQWDRRKLILVTQILSLVEALLLSILVWTHLVAVWHIIVLSVVLGLVGAFDMPARQAFMVEIVEDREDLGNAIALNSSQFNLARLIGPAIAGFTIHLVGEAMCFFLNAVSYVAVIIALLMMNVKPMPKKERKHISRELKEGFVYSFGFPPVRAILISLGVVSFSAGFYAVLMPVFAKTVFHGDADTLSFLLSSIGLGALIGGIHLASRTSVQGLGKFISVAAVIYGISLILFALSSTLIMACIVLVFTGFGIISNMAASNTLLQQMLDDELRGRVMAFYTMSFLGAMPIGSLLGGYLADVMGAQQSVAIGGGVGLLAGIGFYLYLPRVREHARPVLQKKGAIPYPAGGGS